MGLEVNWRPHAMVSGLHTAEALATNQTIVDERLKETLTTPALDLAAEIRAADLPSARFWRHLIPLAGTGLARRPLVETAVAKTVGRGPRLETIVAKLDPCIAEVESAVRRALPQLNDELPLREGPIREQWEARGAGMLQEIGRLTEPALIPERCDVLLLHPALGGGGKAHLAYNSVRLEGVLANPVAQLPEVVRLAWLVAQLNLDLPAHSEAIHADRLPHIARFAMLVPALIAAESVELVRFAPDEVSRAIAAWRLSVPDGVDGAALVRDWWQTYVDARPPWSVALAALDQLFG
jgi:hypothetical protein